MQREITIEIKGRQGAGKSILSDKLVALFKELGAEVTVNDGGRCPSQWPLPSLRGTSITINVEQC